MTIKRWSFIRVCLIVAFLGPSTVLSLMLNSKYRQEEALQHLLKVFGISSPLNNKNTHSQRHHKHLQMPPQYMLDLYKLVADNSGITKSPNPYNANVIRCLPDRDVSKSMHFQFNLNGIESNEKVLQAEFHLYKTRPSARIFNSKQMSDDVKSHLLEMSVYQVMGGNGVANRLLDARRVSSYSIGWEIFHVKAAVNDWMKNQSTNHGILVTLKNLNGEKADDNLIRVLKRRHYSNKHPILVLFTDDGRPRPPAVYPTEVELAQLNLSKTDEENNYDNVLENKLDGDVDTEDDAAFFNFQLNSTKNVSHLNSEVKVSVRRRRELKSQPDDNLKNKDSNRLSCCARHNLYVDFNKVGWSSWIISPKGYNAFYCQGSCLFPLGSSTNHASVQRIVQELQLQEGIGSPSCVPNNLFYISLLYFDEIGNVVLKYYEDMVAASCGCR